jgi:hypothetical protein
MRKITHYILIRDYDYEEFSKLCTNAIAGGYQPYASPFVSPTNFYQAMVKYKPKKNTSINLEKDN